MSEDLTEFIKDLESGFRGIGLNISNYLKSKKDSLRFTNIIRKSLDSLYKKTHDCDEGYKTLYEKFYDNLVDAQISL